MPGRITVRVSRYREQTYLSTCPCCQEQIDVTSLEPFRKLKCPFCGQMVRVRRKFDHFTIVRQIGEGGMSRVFEAEDEHLGRRVALKILNQKYGSDEKRVKQFRQEARITANVNHVNVIKLYTTGYDQGYFYIAMELVDGGSLEQRIKERGKLPETEVLKIGREVAEGLRAANRLGLVHRDVKPANILFTETGTAKVVDFGLAVFYGTQMDESGEIWATPYYVAPEVVLKHEEDLRSDIYSLGATLYHALTGKPPHKADTNSLDELKKIKSKRVSLSDSGLHFSHRTELVVNRLLAQRPEDRPGTYDELVEQLRLAEGLVGRVLRRVGRRRVQWAVAAALILLTAFVSGWLIRSAGEKQAKSIVSTAAADKDLLTGGVTLKAGEKTVAERFVQARRLMLEEGRFAEARHQFGRLVSSGEARQPTLNWARFNLAICGLILGKPVEAQQHFADMGETIRSDDSVVVSDGARSLFSKLSTRLGSRPAAGLKVESLRYETTDEELMGYLAHGVSEWYQGDAEIGASSLKFFLAHLDDVATSTTSSPHPLEWMQLYQPMVEKRFGKDIEIIESIAGMDVGSDTASLQAAMKAVRDAKSSLSEGCTFVKVLEVREKLIQSRLGKLRLDEQRKRMAEATELRGRELAQLGEVVDALPALVQGYDYTRAVAALNEMHFESPEVQAAVDGRRYLFSEAAAFIEQIFADIRQVPYNGDLVQHSGPRVSGSVVEASLATMRVAIDRGEIELATDSLTPECLIEIAQHYLSQITDSTDYYTRQERLAVFARVNGLQSLSAVVAARLMEENRGFRARWMKVLQGGI